MGPVTGRGGRGEEGLGRPGGLGGLPAATVMLWAGAAGAGRCLVVVVAVVAVAPPPPPPAPATTRCGSAAERLVVGRWWLGTGAPVRLGTGQGLTARYLSDQAVRKRAAE